MPVETGFILDTHEEVSARVNEIKNSWEIISRVLPLPKQPAEIKDDAVQQAARIVQHTAQVETQPVAVDMGRITEAQALDAVNQLHLNQNNEPLVETTVAPVVRLPARPVNPTVTAAQQAVNDVFQDAA